jgi:hypothetical protein
MSDKPSTLDLLKAATNKAAAPGPEAVPVNAEALLEQEVAADPPEEPPFDLEPQVEHIQTVTGEVITVVTNPVALSAEEGTEEVAETAQPTFTPIKLTAGQIDTLTAAQLNKTAHEHNIVIEGWPGMKVEEKKATLKNLIHPEYVDKETPEQEILPPAKPAGADKPVAKIKNTTKVGVNTDPLVKMSFEIENMDEAQLHTAVKSWVQRQSLDFFALGGYLTQMQMNAWFGQYKNMEEFCKAELELSYRTARYMMVCYEGILEAGLTADQVQQMGWSKLKDVVPLLNKDNVEDWVQKALTHNVSDFQELVKAEKGDDNSSGAGPDTATDKVIKTASFKLLNDQIDTVKQALDKAKAEGNTESDSVALEYLALSYLNGGGIVQQAGPADLSTIDATELPVDKIMAWMKNAGAQISLEIIGEVFPDLAIECSELPST